MGGDYVAVQLDAVREEFLERESDAEPAAEEELAVVRVVTTRRRLEDLAGGTLLPGDWVRLEVTPPAGAMPRVWFYNVRDHSFDGDGPRPFRGSLASIERLPRVGEPLPRSLGSAANPVAQDNAQKAAKLRKRHDLSTLTTWKADPGVASDLLSLVCTPTEAIALDVGQANFCLIRSEHGPVLYFDVGQPIWLHLDDVPPGFDPDCDPHGVVVLSHWDTDHYAYGRNTPAFRDLWWFAPVQVVGPAAYRFARQLAASGNLILLSGRADSRSRPVTVIPCSGGDLNGSGLALDLRAGGRRLLLTGDADYTCIPNVGDAAFDGVQVPHHGGPLIEGCPAPTPNPGAVATLSYGAANKYGHPKPATKALHEDAGWTLQHTAATPSAPRGERRI